MRPDTMHGLVLILLIGIVVVYALATGLAELETFWRG